MAKLTRVAPELPVVDLRQSLEYYRDKLGFTVAMRMPDGRYAIVERDDASLHLFERDGNSSSSVAIHIFTHELDALYAELEQRGAHISQGILNQPWGNRDFRVHDDSGNEIKFTEPA